VLRQILARSQPVPRRLSISTGVETPWRGRPTAQRGYWRESHGTGVIDYGVRVSAYGISQQWLRRPRKRGDAEAQEKARRAAQLAEAQRQWERQENIKKWWNLAFWACVGLLSVGGCITTPICQSQVRPQCKISPRPTSSHITNYRQGHPPPSIHNVI
jgi:hypothetical protein